MNIIKDHLPHFILLSILGSFNNTKFKKNYISSSVLIWITMGSLDECNWGRFASSNDTGDSKTLSLSVPFIFDDDEISWVVFSALLPAWDTDGSWLFCISICFILWCLVKVFLYLKKLPQNEHLYVPPSLWLNMWEDRLLALLNDFLQIKHI